jgi:hypothetical protein
VRNETKKKRETNRDSMAYPASAQDDRTPLQVPIAMGSAVW